LLDLVSAIKQLIRGALLVSFLFVSVAGVKRRRSQAGSATTPAVMASNEGL